MILERHKVFYLLQKLSKKPNRLKRKSFRERHSEIGELVRNWWLNDAHVGESMKKFRRDIRDRLWKICINLESRPIEESTKTIGYF